MKNFKVSIEYNGADGKPVKIDTDMNALRQAPKRVKEFLKTPAAQMARQAIFKTANKGTECENCSAYGLCRSIYRGRNKGNPHGCWTAPQEPK
jgi:hypothetical protein